MIRNGSDTKKTLKEIMRSLPGDTWSLDRLIYHGTYGEIMVPTEFILDKFNDHFQNKLIEIELDPKYHYSPTWFSHDYYGTPALDFLVLYFAGMTSLFQFNQDRIKVLPLEALVDINELMVSYADEVSQSKENPTKY